MIKINLMPKPERKETLKVLGIRVSAANKLVKFHTERELKGCYEMIDCLKALLHLHGVNI